MSVFWTDHGSGETVPELHSRAVFVSLNGSIQILKVLARVAVVHVDNVRELLRNTIKIRVTAVSLKSRIA